MCLLICFIFYKYKNTPIVTTSRLRTSIVHLIVIMSIFITVPIAYIGNPNKEKCVLRPLIIAVLYNCNISLLLTKSNKILSAYNSKQVSSVFTVRREKAAEIFVVLLNQAIVLCIVITAFYKDPAKVLRTGGTYDGKVTTVLYCNTMDEQHIAVGILCSWKYCVWYKLSVVDVYRVFWTKLWRLFIHVSLPYFSVPSSLSLISPPNRMKSSNKRYKILLNFFTPVKDSKADFNLV